MQRFDCLARDCPLFGPHLLEASAGTGKTFSIEHIYVRLILEEVEMEQILVITFTRAATRELKARIRSNLEKALAFIQSGASAWEYLEPYLGSKEAIRRLSDALSVFDRCQIFTIHGFCYRMLKEFAFEAKVGALSDPDAGRKVPETLRHAAFDFLENGIADLCPEQLTCLFKEFTSVDAIVDRLLRCEPVSASESFTTISAKCKAALHSWNLDVSKLLADFHALKKNYRVGVKGHFEAQVRALAERDIPFLLKERGSLLDFLAPENRKVRAKDPEFLHYPGFFDWARSEIAPSLQLEVFPILQAAWYPIAQKILAQEEHLDPDAILEKVKEAVGKESFAARVREKYRAAIIDEFQDTDAVQWEIFQRLFVNANLKALYLVGDPKQSIYRFRKADIYTYLQARDLLGETHLYHLDTNFRSSKPLIDALNALFHRDWLPLPKVQRTLPYQRVKAGAKIDPSFTDGKGALHFFLGEGEPNALFDDLFLPFAIREIELLGRSRRCAILVKDRYQAQKALDQLKGRGIAAIAKSHIPLGETDAFQAIRELFEALLSPADSSRAIIVLAGPFAHLDLFEAKALLQKGLVPFARYALKELHDPDTLQVFEQLFAWEKKEGFSFEGLKRFLTVLRHLDPEEGGRRRMEVDEEAVQILHLHISKGLEFDIVFALGLASRTPKSDEDIPELEAEKLRQLYVAMTRAKQRLYVPLALSKKDPEPGTHSPLELFCRHISLDQLPSLCKEITFETLSSPLSLAPPSPKPESKAFPPRPIPHSFSPSFLSSFTTLAQGQESNVKWTDSPPGVFTLQTMPRGSETGILVHGIFERLFSAPTPLWRHPIAIDTLVAEQLRFTPLEPWKEAVQQMVRQSVTLPLTADGEFFALSELEPQQLQVEMEFLFTTPPHFVKGFIDLVFFRRGKVYFIDWKTNWLEQYDPSSLQAAMQTHDYGLQVELYAEAIRRHFQADFGAAFYLFVRGGAYLTL